MSEVQLNGEYHADVNMLMGQLAALREELAKVIEDRARFPDRPDFIGNMISAHIGNLKAKAESAERYARMWSDRLTAAEQRNATLEALLREVTPELDDFITGALLERLKAALAQPTESGASEPKFPKGHFKCLACGGLHPGNGNLPCPKMSPISGASE